MLLSCSGAAAGSLDGAVSAAHAHTGELDVLKVQVQALLCLGLAAVATIMVM